MLKWKNIIFIGMRCTGKSGIGRHVAEKLNYKFIDLDKEIERQCNKSISEITDNGQNWVEFRKHETRILQDIIQQNSVVISCGGGVGVNDIPFDENTSFGQIQAQALLDSQCSAKIWLYSNIEQIVSRFKGDLKNQSMRPLLSQQNNWEIDLVINNYNREKLYRKIATFGINTSNAEDSFLGISAEILQKLSTVINAVIGDPIEHSLSPLIHNAAYLTSNINDKFNFIKLRVKPNELENIRDLMVKNNIRGLSITAPHKEAILPYLDNLDDSAKQIGAVNTVYRTYKNELIGYNTDYVGIIEPITQELPDLESKNVAILGSGGAAKAAAFALSQTARSVTILGRDAKKSRKLAKEFKCHSGSIKSADYNNFDIIINATSCGHKAEESPISGDKILKKHIVFDIIYSPLYTKLIRDAETAGAKVIFGTSMLLHQAARQFEIYTSLKPDINAMELAIFEYLKKQNNLQDIMGRIFISLAPKNIAELSNLLAEIDSKTRNVEIRADAIEGIAPNDIRQIRDTTNGFKTIFTCRKRCYGGKYDGDKYEEIMALASELFDYIDVDHNEFNAIQQISTRNGNAQIIISHHNFQRTDLMEVESILSNFKNIPSKFIKIATSVADFSDNSKLLSLLQKHDDLIVIGMGEKGKTTRLLAPILGSKIAFGCLDENSKTAPGQLTLNQLFTFYSMFFNL